MARDEIEAATCTGKGTFETYGAAEKALKRSKRSDDRERRRREVYRCPFCRKYHLGRPSPERSKKEFGRFMRKHRERYRGNRFEADSP